MTKSPDGKRDFFVSFTEADRLRATWIAWVLEDAGYGVWFQDWDFKGNFILEMDKAHNLSRRTVAVLSPEYLKSGFAAPEWAATFAQDATSEHDLLIPVRVRPCELAGLFAQIGYVDLVGCDEVVARDKILRRVKGIRLKPDEPPLFPGEVSHDAVPERPAFPAARTGGAAATQHVSPHARRPEPDLKWQGPIDAIRGRVFELMKRHGIDFPTMAEILEVPLSMLGHEEFLDRLDNPTLDRLANLFCVKREWLVGESECPMQYDRRWYKQTESLVRHLLVSEKMGLEPAIYFLKPVQMNPVMAMKEEGPRHTVGICVHRTHRTPSGRPFETFEPWAWEPWNYQKCRLDFLSIVMIFDRLLTHKLPSDMKDAGVENEYFWAGRFREIKWRSMSVDDDAISKYRNCKLLLNELITSRTAQGGGWYGEWYPEDFTDRSSATSKATPELEYIEERYMHILKVLASDVRRSRWEDENRR